MIPMRPLAFVRVFVIVLAVTTLLAPNAVRAAGDKDKSFLSTALQENADVRTLSDLAAKKARDPKVRQFAQKLSRTATDFNNTLLALAKRNDVKPPAALSVRASDQYARIDAQVGKGAEQEYLQDVAIDARVSGDDYTDEARTGAEQALRRVAAARRAALDRIAREADALASALH